MPSVQTLQKKLNERIKNKIKNSKNWYGHQPIHPAKTHSDKDVLEYLLNQKTWMNKKPHRANRRQFNNHI